ncbi:Trithorax group protein osa [Halotydeus destructor]|nr:Trithorax group protein osa [Halotydeus destructor]
MVKHHGLMFILSRLLLLNHYHPKKKRISEPSSKVNSDEKDSLFNEDEVMSEVKSDDLSKTDVQSDEDDDSLYDSTDLEWYWDAIHLILENSLVTLANISGQLDMSPFPEHISLPLLDGLLHWAVCTSSYAKDHLPTTSLPVISPQRLALETLVKLSILEGNVDLILATPPWERLDRLFKQLTKSLSRSEDQTLREFSLVLLGNFAASDTGTARSIALTGNAIPQLLAFVEETEQQAMGIASSRGINALRENPELMGTTLDMVRRAAICMRHLARMPENRQLFVNFQQRLLALVMSQILDQGVAAIIADVMYECALSEPVHSSPTPFFPTINLNELIDKRAKSAERLTNGSPEDADFKPDIDPKPSHFKEPIKPEPVQPSNDTVAAKSG